MARRQSISGVIRVHEIRVMGQENIAVVVANVYNYLKNVSIPDNTQKMRVDGVKQSVAFILRI